MRTSPYPERQVWTKPRSVVAKIEWHPGKLYPRVGIIVTNMARRGSPATVLRTNSPAIKPGFALTPEKMLCNIALKKARHKINVIKTKEGKMATLAGQRAQFDSGRSINTIQQTTTIFADKYIARMALYLNNAPENGFSVEQITQGQSYPATEVAKYVQNGNVAALELSDADAIEGIRNAVDLSDVIKIGSGSAAVYAYGYPCAPDRLKIGSTEGDTVTRIAQQITTSTPDRPNLQLEIRTDNCKALEKALHYILELRGFKVSGGGSEWFTTNREVLIKLYAIILGE